MRLSEFFLLFDLCVSVVDYVLSPQSPSLFDLCVGGAAGG